jgi:hypothetical protein
MGDNLASFNKLIKEGKSLEEAAKGTFTGKLAGKNGFNNVVIERTKQDDEGNFTSADVLFKQ